MKKFLITVAVLTLSGCAGSPVHTSSMSPQELMNVDEYTLCKAATPRELYEPSPNVIREVGRRGLDCRRIYAYTPSPVIINSPPPQPQQNTHTYIINGRAVTCMTLGNMTSCN